MQISNLGNKWFVILNNEEIQNILILWEPSADYNSETANHDKLMFVHNSYF